MCFNVERGDVFQRGARRRFDVERGGVPNVVSGARRRFDVERGGVPNVVSRSPASVQQSGQSLDLEPELVSLPSYVLCVLRRVAGKALY
jgi:hypothetical protein